MGAAIGIPFGFVALLVCVFGCAVVATALVLYLKNRRIHRLRDPRRDHYR